MKKLLTKNCPHCDKQFNTYPSINSKYCSKVCSHLAQKAKSYEKYKQTCEICSKDFMPPRPKEGGRFCSYKCRGVSSRKEKVERQGYWCVIVKDHPRFRCGGYVPEHTLVMEKHIGRYLNKKEVVHHINQDKMDNSISNLRLMTDSEHKSLHAKLRRKKSG